MSATHVVTSRAPAWAYGWWFVAGGLAGIGLVGLLTIGLPFLLAAVVLAVVGARRESTRNRAVVAALAGLSAIPLYLAWLNKDGPGEVCTPHNGGTMCGSEASPWPFVAVAVVLVVASVAAALLLATTLRSRAASPTGGGTRPPR